MSRGLAAVVTSQGTLLASVNAGDDAVSLFEYRDGQFHLVSSLATGPQPAQIISADLTGGRVDDLIIRDAGGNGTLVIYYGNPVVGGFGSPIVLGIGPGISDVAVARLTPNDVPTVVRIDQENLPAILLANQTSGLVDVILNLGNGTFSQPALYRAGTGLSAIVGGDGTSPGSVLSMDGTVGVAAATLSPGLPEIVTLDSGAETLGILPGLGQDRFANPDSLPTTGPTLAVRVADLTGNGIDDLAILGPNSVTIWMGNGQGGLVQGKTYDAGPDPTGLAIADVNGDKVPDLVIGNAFGDVRMLVGNGDGTFQTQSIADKSVSLAVTNPTDGSAPTFVLADQSQDSVVLRSGSQTTAVLADRTTGLQVPGDPILADLNGDGIPDLIFLNTGGNSIIVRPGLANGQFGPPVNDGLGFPTGTSPVAVIAESLSPGSLPDLLIADKGSNSVSVLMNESQGSNINFVAGPRLNVGLGPDALLLGDFFGNGGLELAVSNSGSNNVMLLPSLGGGFFNDQAPMTIQLSETPGPLIFGDFGVQAGRELVTLDPGTSEVTVISGLSTGTPLLQNFYSGGTDPVAAITVEGSNGFDDLVVANNGDGQVALLAGGLGGLTVESVQSVLSPTGLVLASFQNNTLEVFASAVGSESAIPLTFSLVGTGVSTPGLALLPLRDSAFPLIATLLTSFGDLNAPEDGSYESQEGETVAAVSATTSSLGQGPLSRTTDDLDELNEDELAADDDEKTPVAGGQDGLSAWKRIEMGLDQAFEEFRRAFQSPPPAAGGGDEAEEPTSPEAVSPAGLSGSVRHADESDQLGLVDAAIASLAARGADGRVLSTLAREDCARRPNVPVEHGSLDAIALVMLHASLAMTSLQPARPSLTPQRVRPARHSRD